MEKETEVRTFFINIRRRSGPSRELCGTPQMTGAKTKGVVCNYELLAFVNDNPKTGCNERV